MTAVRILFWVSLGVTAGAAGAPGPEALAPSGPGPSFALRQTNGHWWMVAPDGRPFVSLGVNVVTRGHSRETFDRENPGYAAWQHYGSDRAWADGTLTALRSWNFTTLGAWSEDAILRQSPQMLPVFTPVLHLGSAAGAPWWDMWDDAIVGRMEAVARDQILAVRDDPRLAGYYTDNEMGWWNGALFHLTLEQGSSSGQRRRLLGLLRQAYRSDWNQLRRDFDPELADSFEALEQRGQLWLKPGGRGIVVLRQFLSLVASRYYQLAHDLIRKYDRRALILGDRYQSFYYPEVARAAAPWVDAISSNLNASWNDGSFPRFHLETLHRLTGRPILISEFYLAAAENRTGNRNNHGQFPVVPTQRARAAAVTRTLNELVRLPYVVGADWFQYFDEPRHGRDDGENFNFGLVDVWNQPYEDVTRAFSNANLTARKAAPAPPPRPNVLAGIPPAPRDPFANFVPGHALQHWDRERGFVPTTTDHPVADLYLAWSPHALYLGLFGYDFVEEGYYRDKSVPKTDRALWTVRPGSPPGSRPDARLITARIGSGREAIPSDTNLRMACLSGTRVDVRNLAILEVPAERFGRKRLRAGDTIDLQSSLVTHAQAYQVDWKGRYRLAR